MRVIATLATAFVATEAIKIQACPTIVLDTHLSSNDIKNLTCECFKEFGQSSGFTAGYQAQYAAHPDWNDVQLVSASIPNIPLEIAVEAAAKIPVCFAQ